MALLGPYTWRGRWEADFEKAPDEFAGFGATQSVRLGMPTLGALVLAPVAALLPVRLNRTLRP